MGIRRRRRAEAELIELVRTELAALRAEVQAAMTEAASVLTVQVRTELEQRMGEPRALAQGIHGIRNTIATRDSDLMHVLQRVSDTCDALTDRVQVDRIERTALVDAVSRLTTALAVAGTFSPSSPASQPRATVIGGTVDPTPRPDTVDLRVEVVETGPPGEIDLEAAAREPEPPPPRPRSGRPVRPDGVEVRCRFGDRWVTGFEVCEVIRLDDVTRYRLRRRSDGSVIPTLFDEKDLRFFSTAFVDPRRVTPAREQREVEIRLDPR